MIKHVRLENWRAYRQFELDLGEGTTFLVASNGVGKTSFIDAVRWVLDPEGLPDWELMRLRTEDAVVEVVAEAGDVPIRIRKVLRPGRSKKAPDLDVKAWIGENGVAGSEAFAALAAAWRSNATFVNRAAFLVEGFHDKGGDPDLHAHLTNLYALDHLQDAIDVLTPAAKQAMDAADATRKAAGATADAIDRATREAAEAEDVFLAAAARTDSLRAELIQVTTELEEARRDASARTVHASWMFEREGLVADVEALLGPVAPDSSLVDILAAAETGARHQLEELSEQRARLAQTVASIDEALAVLRDAGGDCPVCRRPLDDASRAFAEAQHRHDHEAASLAASTIDTSEPTALVDRLVELGRRAHALGDEPTAPLGEASDIEALVERHRTLNEVFEVALSEAGRARAAKDAADAALGSLLASGDAPSPVALYTKAAALESAKGALEDTIASVLSAQMDPIREEVNRRWEIVFPDRPGLRFGSQGKIVRSFDADDRDLPFASFSAGERVVSKLLLRLAILTSTTSIPFFWVDEPLEHLDPDARRYVARTLAHLSKNESLRQIFVTTYEDGLALKLTDEAPDEVHLVFLRTASVLP